MNENQNTLVSKKPQKRLLSFLWPLVLLFFGILKSFKFLLPLLKLGKFTTLITMVLSVGVYSLHFGWSFALGFVLLIFVHEMGHAIILRREGIASGAPVFIPFMGAFITMKGRARDAWVEAKVAIGGPALGSLGAFVLLIFAHYQHSEFLFALSQVGFLINLFNLLPLAPMDGGRIMGGVSKHFLVFGFLVGCYAFYLLRSPLILLMLVLGGLHIYKLYKNPVPGYYEIPYVKRFAMGGAYLLLLVVLFFLYSYCDLFLKHIINP